MTYLELVEKLRKRTGTGGTQLTDVSNLTGALWRLTDYVNEAWRQMQTARRDWSFRWAEFSEPLTAGSQTYDMDSEIGSGIIMSVQPAVITLETTGTPATRARLQLLNYPYFDELFGDRAAISGRPVYLTIEPPGKKVKFNTILDVNCTLKGKYQKIIQSLVNKDDTPILDPQYHEVIFHCALMKWAEFEEADDIYIKAEKNYSQGMLTMANDLAPKVLVGADALA